MITSFTALLVMFIKGSFMVAGFFFTLFFGFLIILSPFILLAAIFTLLDDGTPPEY